MNIRSKREFRERDFVRLLLYALNVQGIKMIYQRELENKLSPYKLDEKYQILMTDVFPRRNERDLNLSDGMYDARCFGNLIYTINNTNKMILPEIKDDYKQFIEKLYSVDQINLMLELAKEYKLRTDIEAKARYKLNIYGLNPNQDYSLATGVYNRENVTWQLITDGTLSKNSYSVHDSTISCRDPKWEFEGIGLNEVKLRAVIVENASFVIEQGKTDFSNGVSNLYTKIMDKELLEILADYSTGFYSSNSCETLTEEAPYVFSLKKINRWKWLLLSKRE